MPELPEVEIYKRFFERHALGQTVTRVRVLDARIAGTRKLSQLAGREFRRVRRHGKHLFADAGDLWLHIHFGMSGDLAYYRDGDPPRFARLIIDFEGGEHLAYEDMRLFGIVDLTPSPEAYVREHDLGPDPLEIDLRRFRERIAGRRGRIKALLLSQNVIAGVGNLYADEALFRSGLRPDRPSVRLTADEVKTLFTKIRGVLRETIAFKSRGETYPARFLIQHREEGDRCPKCGGTIRRTVVAGRTTYFCARHQT
ncbi:MAG TPA: DNA-formamidopyrimidine glycosylase family protein [Thermoanaerobaculia bacterium]|nr:DNA-formamidopyrimidine glycosylase family protein [Thermoanaerobaculia bacterium]